MRRAPYLSAQHEDIDQAQVEADRRLGDQGLQCRIEAHSQRDHGARHRQAGEAERLRRAKVIDAEGEQQAAEKLAQAGEILSGRPEALQLRYLGALQNIAGERSSTIIFPMPINLFETLKVAAALPSKST
jgi:regulator of protease activity HflC (stomatin/prohibitin superfamily)